MSTKPIVHLIDDDEAVRRSLAFALATGGFTVRAYESGSAFLAAADAALSGCIVTDVRMPGIDGLQLQRELAARGVTLPVIVMTGHADVRLAVEAIRAGAEDFIEKPFADDILLQALHRTIARCDNRGDIETLQVEIRARLKGLSDRERGVLEGLVNGLPKHAIAERLGVRPQMVEVDHDSIMTKMAARSLAELVRMIHLGEPLRPSAP